MDKELVKKIGTRIAEAVAVTILASLGNSIIEKGVKKIRDAVQKKSK